MLENARWEHRARLVRELDSEWKARARVTRE
jgi:hypothetical protein